MLITNDHDDPEVVPGRYPGAAIPMHDGPTAQSVAYQEQGRGPGRWRVGCRPGPDAGEPD